MNYSFSYEEKKCRLTSRTAVGRFWTASHVAPAIHCHSYRVFCSPHPLFEEIVGEKKKVGVSGCRVQEVFLRGCSHSTHQYPAGQVSVPPQITGSLVAVSNGSPNLQGFGSTEITKQMNRVFLLQMVDLDRQVRSPPARGSYSHCPSGRGMRILCICVSHDRRSNAWVHSRLCR